MTLSPRQRFQLETSLFFVASLVFVASALYWGWFRSADRWFYDALIKTVRAPLTEDVIIVGIDDQSLDDYGPWPWPRAQQAELLAAVGAAKPRAIFLDVVFAGRSRASDDASLVAAASSIDALALPMIIDAVANHAQLIEVLPFPDLLEQTDITGHAHVELDEDAIVRGTYLYQGIGDARWPHVAVALAEHLGSLPEQIHRCPQMSDDFSIQNRRCDYVYSPFVGPPGSFPEVSALAVLRSASPLEALQGHIVFIGMVASGTTDLVTTPVSGESRPMSGVEYNANLYNALVQDLLKRDAPLLWIYLINLLCVSIPVLILPRLKAKGMLGFALLCALIPAATMAATLIFASLWIPLASAALICLLSYPYWSWRRHEVAWQFVEAEIVRLDTERARWDLDAEKDHPRLELQRLQDFLGAELVDQPIGWLPDGTDSIDISLGQGEPVLLRRREVFSKAEKALAANTLGSLTDAEHKDDGLPGELLVAEIRRLQNQAAEVRLGREISQRGLEQMPNGVVVFSATGDVLFINSAGRRFLGFAASVPAEYRELLAAISPPLGQNWRELARSVVLEQRTISFETHAATNEQVVIEAAPLTESRNPADTWVLTITDMTDIRTAERDREEALAFLSHDLRSPMLSVLALVRASDRRPPLDAISDYAQRALQVSDQFVQLSRVQAREQFERYEVNVLAVLRNAVEQMYALAHDKKIDIITDDYLDENEEGVWLSANGELLERTFVNLLANAIKYSEPGSTVGVEIEDRASEISVHIVDNGMGIPESEIDHIFEPYFRSSAEQLARERGAGLGLRFVKTVIERHGGTVHATSVFGEGSRFTITLPKPAEQPT